MTEVRDEQEKQALVAEDEEKDATQQPDEVIDEQKVTGEQQLPETSESDQVALAPQESAGTDLATQAQQQYEETFIKLEQGAIIKGRVVQVGDDEVMVDVGYKSEGRIPLHEIGLRSGQRPADVLNVGDEIDVYILKVEDTEGNVLLSKKRADSRVVWEKLENMFAEGQIFEATVTERVKGGLLVDVGVRGFVPASHVARNYVENLEKYVGQTLRFKIVEIDRQRNNVVLSRKQVLEEEYISAKEEVFQSIKEGTVLPGVVRRITDFGAFVDIGSGVEGLLHVSEMAWSRVKHPSDVVKENDEIQVMVLNVDREHERISLSLKETLPDPWETVASRYVVGEIVEGEVTRVVDFGAFIKLEDGIEGLVHISQLAEHHVNNPAEIVRPGDTVQVKIVTLDERARRIGLSVKEAQPKPVKQQKSHAEPTGYTDPDAETLKLGDVFKDLSTLLEQQNDEEEVEE
jgi:ribosomal protein S1